MTDDTGSSGETGSTGDNDSSGDEATPDDGATDGSADGPGLSGAVDEFLDRTDAALADYDKGYADADATLRVVRAHLDDLRAAAAE